MATRAKEIVDKRVESESVEEDDHRLKIEDGGD
jgi:hypothetical protein